MDFEGRVAVVTGASSGIGDATARLLARRGATVVAVARREDRLAALVDGCRSDSPSCSYLAGDLGDRDFARRVVDDTVRLHGRVDVLVNNAGVPKHKLIYDVSVDEAEEVMRINFLSCLWTSFAAIPHMLVAGEGAIVNVSSFGSKVVPTHESIYAASKFALNGLTEGLWNDLRGSGIHVSLVHPGPIETEIWTKLDEPGAYEGKRYPADRVARDIVGAIENRRHEIISPRFNPQLLFARFLRLVAPPLLRAGVARMDGVKPESVVRARERAKSRIEAERGDVDPR